MQGIETKSPQKIKTEEDFVQVMYPPRRVGMSMGKFLVVIPLMCVCIWNLLSNCYDVSTTYHPYQIYGKGELNSSRTNTSITDTRKAYLLEADLLLEVELNSSITTTKKDADDYQVQLPIIFGSQKQQQEKNDMKQLSLNLSDFEVGNYTYLTIPNRDPQWEERLARWQSNSTTNPAKNKTTMPGGWIHIGKSGGTTLEQIIVKKKKKKSIREESYMAKFVRRLHMGITIPGKKPPNMTEYDFFVWLVRDPFERTGSAFTYMHPANKLSPREFIKKYTHSLKCFDSFERFTYYLDNNTIPSNTTYSHESCWGHAQGLLHHRVQGNILDLEKRRFGKNTGGHLYWDTGYWVNEVKSAFPLQQNEYNNNNKTNFYPYMMVIRNENLWADFKMVNWLLGQNWTEIKTYEDKGKGKDFSEISYPVTRNLTDIGKQRLCRGLDREYQDYFWVLRQAANLGPNDIQAALDRAHKNCPNLTIH